MWGDESPARARLFELAMLHTQSGDFILILDADMVPARSPRPLMEAHADAWSFPLYDLWGPGVYRDDQFWQGHNHPRIWMIRRPHDNEWQWNPRGIHTGHFPLNLHFPKGVGVAPYDMGLLHYGYFDAELRAQAYARYMAVSHQLAGGERRHAESILDPNPRTLPLSFECEFSLTKEVDEQRLSA